MKEDRFVKHFLRLSVAALALFSLLAADALGATKYGERTLRRGSHGSDVKTMQRYLTKMGFRTSADGAFGRGTERRVKAFEKSIKHRRNGVLTRSEQKRLRSVVRAKVAADGGATTMESTPSTTSTAPTGKATLNPDGTATAPADAPPVVKKLIAAGNEIAKKPYRYGGGHASFPEDSGYDCSGSVSYVLYKAGLLKSPRASSGFMTYGRAGRGKWISTYAHSGHMYLRVAGLRFDTSGLRQDGTRWHSTGRSADGFTIRHPAGY